MAKRGKDPESGENDPKPEISVVTGANGRLGKELVKLLLKRGDSVRALVQRKDFIVELPTGVVPYQGDINDPKALDDICKDADNVYHLAAIVSEYKATTEEIMRVNAEGTRSLMEACEANEVGQIIFTSSVDVYGTNRRDVLTEESKLMPKDRYGLSKMIAEQVIMRYKATVPYTIFRMANLYGPGYEDSFFKIFKVIKDGKAHIIGDGQNKLNIVHLYDVLQAMTLAKMKDAGKGNIYNLTDGNTYTQQYLYNLAADLMKVPRPTSKISKLVIKLVAKRRGVDSDELRFLTSSRVIDISKVIRELGYKPMINVEVGGAEMVRDFMEKEKKLDQKPAF